MSIIPPRSSSNPMQSSGRRWARLLIVAILVLVSTSVGVVAGSHYAQQQGATASTMLTQIPEFDIVQETYDAIRENYVLSDDISDAELMYGASSGMVEALGDEGHSTFLDPERAKKFVQQTRGELIGIGIRVDANGPMPIIIAPIDGSPAFEAGIRPGDVIVAVDGVLASDVGSEAVVDLIAGDPGTDVTLTIRHQDELEPIDLVITRAKISVDPVSWVMLPNDILWLRVASFDAGTTQGVTKALEFGNSQGMKGVILDLRNNPGGLVVEAIGAGSQFLPASHVLYKEQDKRGNIEDVDTIGNGGLWQDGPLVVLINAGSASAAEIVASGIQANGRGTLIGETTFGTGTVLTPVDFDDGSMVLIGTSLWLTANGDQIWKKGVDPDIEVTLEPGVSPRLPFEFEEDIVTSDELSNMEDTQLLRAYDIVAGGD